MRAGRDPGQPSWRRRPRSPPSGRSSPRSTRTGWTADRAGRRPDRDLRPEAPRPLERQHPPGRPADGLALQHLPLRRPAARPDLLARPRQPRGRRPAGRHGPTSTSSSRNDGTHVFAETLRGAQPERRALAAPVLAGAAGPGAARARKRWTIGFYLSFLLTVPHTWCIKTGESSPYNGYGSAAPPAENCFPMAGCRPRGGRDEHPGGVWEVSASQEADGRPARRDVPRRQGRRDRSMEQVVLLRVFNGKGIDGEKLWAGSPAAPPSSRP